VDYRKFLGATRTMVLPHAGGFSVHAADRRLRVNESVAVGWWRFEVKGRTATPIGEAEPPPLDHLPSVRGHVVGDWLFTGGDTAVHIDLMSEEEAPVLGPVIARRWPGDVIVFDASAFEDEAEEMAREALLEGSTIEGLRGATPSLRGAFGYARLVQEARRRGMRVRVREVLWRVHAVAMGQQEARALLDELEARVFQLDPRSTHRERTRPEPVSWRGASPEERAADILEAAGASMLSGRVLEGGRYEVVFRYLGERFIAVVDRDTLHVYDAGICLDGHDEQLGLDSLPSVIAEAIDGGVLYITRR